MALSSVGKKLLMAITGLAWVGFLVGHLGGNFLLLAGKDSFNSYAHNLESMGLLLYIAEAGLLALILAHAINGVSITLSKKKARPTAYAVSGNAGGPSKKSWSSRTMILSGMVVLVFIAVHIKTFKFGAEYPTQLQGETVRDLHKLVAERFSRGEELYVGFYIVCMIFLGIHLRHACWSALQSLGLYHPKYDGTLYIASAVLAGVLAAGFVFLPVWMWIQSGG